MSVVRVINKALAIIGDELIVDEREETENARYARTIAWDAVDYVLSRGQWSDATFRRHLTPDATAPAHTYTRRFMLPNDPRCLVVWKVENTNDYKKEGNYLVSNEAYMDIVFTGAIRDMTFASPELVECCAAKLAMDMASRFDFSAQKLQYIKTYFDEVVAKALNTDSANNASYIYSVSNVWVNHG